MLKLLFNIFFFKPFINVVSHSRPLKTPASRSFLSRLPLFPLPTPVTFLPGSRPPLSPHLCVSSLESMQHYLILPAGFQCNLFRNPYEGGVEHNLPYDGGVEHNLPAAEPKHTTSVISSSTDAQWKKDEPMHAA